jgi:methylated-DNA-[protein]-cysteine S-methyltransferase
MLKKIVIRHYASPAGDLILGSLDGSLCLCDWDIEKRRERIDRRLEKTFSAQMMLGESEVTDKAMTQLEEYFSHQRTSFDIQLLFAGTDFQKRVWRQLLEIPYGDTLSYGELACKMGCPSSVRAVANANGANAISIFVPCHRIIGSNYQLVGYGGGIEAKRCLLELERSATFVS